jgi:hypothetical protein
MRNILALVGAAVVTVLGVGWYLDWFHVRRAPSPDGKTNVNVEFNTNKISEDLHRGTEKIHDLIGSHGRKIEDTPPNPFSPTSSKDTAAFKLVPNEKDGSQVDGPDLGGPPVPPVPFPMPPK